MKKTDKFTVGNKTYGIESRTKRRLKRRMDLFMRLNEMKKTKRRGGLQSAQSIAEPMKLDDRAKEAAATQRRKEYFRRSRNH